MELIFPHLSYWKTAAHINVTFNFYIMTAIYIMTIKGRTAKILGTGGGSSPPFLFYPSPSFHKIMRDQGS